MKLVPNVTMMGLSRPHTITSPLTSPQRPPNREGGGDRQADRPAPAHGERDEHRARAGVDREAEVEESAADDHDRLAHGQDSERRHAEADGEEHPLAEERAVEQGHRDAQDQPRRDDRQRSHVLGPEPPHPRPERASGRGHGDRVVGWHADCGLVVRGRRDYCPIVPFGQNSWAIVLFLEAMRRLMRSFATRNRLAHLGRDGADLNDRRIRRGRSVVVLDRLAGIELVDELEGEVRIAVEEVRDLAEQVGVHLLLADHARAALAVAVHLIRATDLLGGVDGIDLGASRVQRKDPLGVRMRCQRVAREGLDLGPGAGATVALSRSRS